MKAAERRKAKQDGYRDAGLCVVVWRRGKRWYSRLAQVELIKRATLAVRNVWSMNGDMQEGSGSTLPGVDFPTTMTGFHYRVKATGDVGKIKPCPCDDPVILEFQGRGS